MGGVLRPGRIYPSALVNNDYGLNRESLGAKKMHNPTIMYTIDWARVAA